MILEAYKKGLLSKDECTKILGIDPNMLLNNDNTKSEQLYNLSSFLR